MFKMRFGFGSANVLIPSYNRQVEKLLILRQKFSNYVPILIVFFFLFSLFRNVSKVKKAVGRIEKKKQEVVEIEEENRKLQERLEKVQSDIYIEKQMRDKLGLAKEEEVVIIMPDEEILRKLAPTYPEEEQTLPDPNWKKWAQLFL